MAAKDEFLVVRRRSNGTEVELGRMAFDGTQADEDRVRALAYQAARQNRVNNPAWLIYVFGPTNGAAVWTDDDIVWSSLLSD